MKNSRGKDVKSERFAALLLLLTPASYLLTLLALSLLLLHSSASLSFTQSEVSI